MGTQCRGKDPSSCRVHGTTDPVQRLEEVAKHATEAKDVDLYMTIRAQIDAVRVAKTTSSVISDEAVEAAAQAYWDERTPGVWDNKLGDDWKDLYREDSRKELEAAAPFLVNNTITDEAVAAVARTGWELRDRKGDWDAAPAYWQSIYQTSARVSLTAALPYLSSSSK